MTRSDRLIERFAFAAGLIGILVMLGFMVLLWQKGHGPTAEIDVAKTGQIGDFIGGVSGSLIALSAGLLFYLTLTLQRREFKNSLQELHLTRLALVQTARHHENTLAVVREEKEFNVCITALKDLKTDWAQMLSGFDKGGGQWMQISHAWTKHYNLNQFFQHNGLQRLYRRDSGPSEFTLLDYVEVVDLAERTKWLVDSIATKDLATSERFYLAQLASPTIHDICFRMIPCFERVDQDMRSILANTVRLSEYNTDSDHLTAHRLKYVLAQLNHLRDAHSRLNSIKSPVQ